MHSRPFFVALAVMTSALLLSACAPASQPSPTEASALTEDIQNCGHTLTVPAPPERVLTIKSTATEMMLALELEERLVGTAFLDGAPAPQWSHRLDDVPLVSDRIPARESTLALAPDLIYSGWESAFSDEGVGQREALGPLGVQTYVSPAACRSEGALRGALTFDDINLEITEVADLFDVPERADELIATQKATLADITPDARQLTALWYSSGSDTPYVGGGWGAPALIMSTVGLHNAFDEIEDGWASVSWETVAHADPDVIVLVDSAWGSVDKKIGVLESHPVMSETRAVRERRYVVVPFPAGEAGVRTAEAVQRITTQLTEHADW